MQSFLRPILFVDGLFLLILGAFMFLPILAGLFIENQEWQVFAISSAITLFFGFTLIFLNQDFRPKKISVKQAFLLTTFSWVSLGFFASLPFKFGIAGFTFLDSIFESSSAITTTGATIFIDLENLSDGILLWRSLLQWFGGIGIIVMAMAIMPILKIGGMSLFRAESSDNSQRHVPRVARLCFGIFLTYLILTICCIIGLFLAGMNWFDAINHGFTTIATAGFSTRNESIAYFDNVAIEMVMIFFMLLSVIPYVLYIYLFTGKSALFFKEQQILFFGKILLASYVCMFCWLYYSLNLPFEKALRGSLFNVTSLITTSGFANADYSAWGGFIIILVFLLAIIGGCTGSTSGGVKIFRIQVLVSSVRTQIHRLIHPHGIFNPQYNKKPITEQTINAVLSFVVIFFICVVLLAIILSLTGLDYITSVSGSVAMLTNLGPGLGETIGPAGNYAQVNDFAKSALIMGMFLGRLEIFTILVLFSRSFWRS